VWFVTVLPGVLNPDAGDSNRTKEDVRRGGRLKVTKKDSKTWSLNAHGKYVYFRHLKETTSSVHLSLPCKRVSMRGGPNSRPCNLDVDTQSGSVAVDGEETRSEGLNRDRSTCKSSKGACKGKTQE
jgi:hypothetical protein